MGIGQRHRICFVVKFYIGSRVGSGNTVVAHPGAAVGGDGDVYLSRYDKDNPAT